jgi:hypothetical protein
MHNFKIVSNGTNMLDTKIFLDGEFLEGVQSISFSHDVDGWPIMNISILRPKVEMEISIPETSVINDKCSCTLNQILSNGCKCGGK